MPVRVREKSVKKNKGITEYAIALITIFQDVEQMSRELTTLEAGFSSD
ncbi:hypothetical protein [Coleofasciculus sp. H7-2]